jgi:hypothetical protein
MSDNIFDTSGSVDPALFGETGNSTDTGAESTATNEGGAQATQETQMTNQETQQQKAPDTTETPKLFANKYKSPEDLERAYTELQKSFTKATMELSQMRNTQANPNQDTSPNARQANDQKEQDYDWYAAYQQDPVAATYQMIQSMMQQSLQGVMKDIEPIKSDFALGREIDNLLAQHPDAGEYADKIQQVIDTMPQLRSIPNYLEVAYKMASSEVLAEKAKTAFDAGKNAAYQLDQQKQTNVFDNKTTREQVQPTPEEQIMKEIMKAGGKWGSFG